MSIKQVHLLVQGKGGAGKTTTAIVISQYLISKYSGDINLFDIDPVNRTFSRYKALNVEVLNIVNTDSVIDHSKFDDLVEYLIYKDGIAVVDSGSTTFQPLMQYIKSNGVIEILREHGVGVVFHIPLQSGGGLSDTLEGLHTILETFTVPVVVWLNQNLGEIKDFKNSKLYEQYADRILGVCEIIKRKDLFESDIKRMFENHLTLEEIKQTTDPRWRLMSKQRINTFYCEIFKQLDEMQLLPTPAAKQGKEKADKVEKSTATA